MAPFTAQRPVAAVNRDRSAEGARDVPRRNRKHHAPYLDALLNRGDFAAFFADEVLWTTMETGDQIRGREAVRDFIIALHTQLFDASPEIVSTEFADGVAGLEAVFVGTHTAEFAGVPATGAAVRLPYSVFYDISDGKILALRAYFPITALLHQLREAASAHA